jgi:hypothetical protein
MTSRLQEARLGERACLLVRRAVQEIRSLLDGAGSYAAGRRFLRGRPPARRPSLSRLRRKSA